MNLIVFIWLMLCSVSQLLPIHLTTGKGFTRGPRVLALPLRSLLEDSPDDVCCWFAESLVALLI